MAEAASATVARPSRGLCIKMASSPITALVSSYLFHSKKNFTISP
jgi:hypothetical protein